MSVDDLLKTKRDQIFSLASRYGACTVRVFGSTARGETSPNSDIDFLIELEPGRSLPELSALTLDLQELLGRRVDVVPDPLNILARASPDFDRGPATISEHAQFFQTQTREGLSVRSKEQPNVRSTPGSSNQTG